MKKLLTALTVLLLPAIVQAGAGLKPGATPPKIDALVTGASAPSTAGKVVLVDFWASWCVPCKISFPVLDSLHRKYADKGLVVIGLGVDDKPEDYKRFVSQTKVSFPTIHDVSHKAAEAFGPSAMPTSYLIDRKGVIRFVHNGFKGASTEAEYVKEITQLLAEGK